MPAPRVAPRTPIPAVLLVLLLGLSTALQAAPGLMRATAYRGDIELSRWLVSEKLDGVRGRWDGQRMWSRGGQPIALPAGFTVGWPALPMDGELWIGRGEFEAVSALVRRHTPDPGAWQRVRFMVFDLPAHPGSFAERVVAMRGLIDGRAPQLAMIEQRRIADAAALDDWFRAVLADGGEGLMLHRADARYRDGRSDALLKLKPFEDAEGTVVGHTAGRGKYRGLTGALVLELDNGRRLRVGSGLSDADRADPPPTGSRVTFRYSGLTSTGLPRFARYLRVRND